MPLGLVKFQRRVALGRQYLRGDPAPRFGWMAAAAPAAKLVVAVPITGGEDRRGDRRSVVIRPAPNTRIEQLDQVVLTDRPVFADEVAECASVPPNCLLAGCEVGLETQKLTVVASAAVGRAHAVLADRAAQKVEAHLPLVVLKGVGDARLAGFEFQTHPRQPGFQGGSCGLHPGKVRMEHDQLIGVADELGPARAMVI